ncbi:MAG: ribosomal protein L13e [Candidatus Methanofastidiosia archaeon]
MIKPGVNTTYQNTTKEREGRGFSKNELKEAGMSIKNALRIGLPVDKRRKTSYQKNIKIIVSTIKRIEKMRAVKTKKTSEKSTTKKEVKAKQVKKEEIPLENIPGVGPKTAERLKDAGYKNSEDIAKTSPEKLAEIKGISKKSAKELVEKAKGI